MKRAFLLVILITLLLSGCAPRPTVPASTNTNITNINNSAMFRVVDVEAGVVYWMTSPSASMAGISCLPISQTKLDQ